MIAKNVPVVLRMVRHESCQIDSFDSNGLSALLVAVRARSIDIITALIQAGAQFHEEEECGRTPIHECATRNFAGPNDQIGNKNVLIIIICFSKEGVYLLASFGADVRMPLRSSGSTPLHMYMHLQLEI